MTSYDNIEEPLKGEKLIDVWGRHNPRFEKKYEQSVLRVLSTYGVKASETTEAKGKVFGAGYEPMIMAFFIGLYANKRLPLSDDPDDLKGLGQPLMFWGNNGNKLRKTYPRLREYIFDALVAKTDIDWVALDKGEIKVSAIITQLINTMEEYVNYGFSVIEEKLEEDKGYFFSQRAFLDMFMQLTENDVADTIQKTPADNNDVEPL